VEDLKRLKALEEESVKDLSEAAKLAKNPVIDGLLNGLVYDSRKHSSWLDAMIGLKTRGIVTETEKDQLLDLLKSHVATEKSNLEEYQKLIKEAEARAVKPALGGTTEDNAIKACLGAILEDEKRHHGILEQLINTLSFMDTSVVDVWWRLWTTAVPAVPSRRGGRYAAPRKSSRKK
jgi:rubrerythrin